MAFSLVYPQFFRVAATRATSARNNLGVRGILKKELSVTETAREAGILCYDFMGFGILHLTGVVPFQRSTRSLSVQFVILSIRVFSTSNIFSVVSLRKGAA